MRQNGDIPLYQSKKPSAVNAADSAGKLRSGRLLHVIHAVEKDSQKDLNVAAATHLTLPLTLPHNDQSVAQARHIDIPLNHLLVKLLRRSTGVWVVDNRCSQGCLFQKQQ